MKTPLTDKTILLAVTGSIAAFKAVDLASKLAQSGAQVDVVLTEAAQEFVSPLSFRSVTGGEAYTDEDLWGDAGHILHIGLVEAADLMVIAPATANTLARLAHGMADNLVSLAALAARCPLLVAPAMDGGMWSHPATQANVAALAARGVLLAGPAAGRLASGQTGAGRMLEPADLFARIRHLLSAGGPLEGLRVVVSAGGTQEPLDPVRVLTNRSSGKQGFALAQAALDLGAEVTLVAAPSALPTPYGADRVDVRTAEEMLAAVEAACANADALVMAAAVADFRPAQAAGQKIKKEAGVPEIRLEPVPDILAAIGAARGEGNSLKVVVGFAAESRDLLENARAKLEKKNLDLIVANDISAADAGFEVDTNRVTLLFAGGRTEPLPLLGKDAVAERVMREVARLLLRS
ncbi:MAG TPA: bifunctional phosphopantothenoylcysteine decarboxylase/phosphopantothenate--cysteine ligase CoaBC [Anaerolineales bacterium]|nr:bifunctional phosphopantothenoylcysteine decarboxylase/phosphopantothenate--cysteine ligase CoaBC [Anaerolineales bacterium]